MTVKQFIEFPKWIPGAGLNGDGKGWTVHNKDEESKVLGKPVTPKPAPKLVSTVKKESTKLPVAPKPCTTCDS